MTDFQGAPRVTSGAPRGGRALETIEMCIVGSMTVAALYFGREVFLPIAIAVLLSFVLAPPVRLLRRWHFGRIAPVIIVVTLAFAGIFAVGTLLARQITQLADDLPRYQETIAHKIESVRGAATGMTFVERASNALSDLGQQLSHRPQQQNNAQQPGSSTPTQPQPVPVEVHQPPSGPLEVLEKVAATVFQPLATTAIVAVFVIFILLQREDLRDRVIRLAGSHDLSRTTAAIDDAARRLSRYFLAQTSINAAFGIIVAISLTMIGVPSPILWGIVAMLMRFVPYVGSFVAAIFPIVIAAAVDPGWSMVISTALVFLIGEPFMGQVVEPLLYGHSTGLSPIAVVISATFWTWLWGPVGLLLATPLTVCLVVLGRHVEKLEFLDVLLGDRPPLTPVESFYQRVLAGHAAEAAEQAEKHIKADTLLGFYDEIALPGLLMAQQDLTRGTLDETREAKILATIEELVDDLEDHEESTPDRKDDDGQEAPAQLGSNPPEPHPEVLPVLTADQLQPAFRTEHPVLCIAGRGPLDEAAAMMLAQILRKHGVGARTAPAESLGFSRGRQAELEGVALICLSYLDVDMSPTQVRFAVRRLRRRAPHVRIMTGFWRHGGPGSDWCEQTRADDCRTTFASAADACLRLAMGQIEKPAEPNPKPVPVAAA